MYVTGELRLYVHTSTTPATGAGRTAPASQRVAEVRVTIDPQRALRIDLGYDIPAELRFLRAFYDSIVVPGPADLRWHWVLSDADLVADALLVGLAPSSRTKAPVTARPFRRVRPMSAEHGPAPAARLRRDEIADRRSRRPQVGG